MFARQYWPSKAAGDEPVPSPASTDQLNLPRTAAFGNSGALAFSRPMAADLTAASAASWPVPATASDSGPQK